MDKKRQVARLVFFEKVADGEMLIHYYLPKSTQEKSEKLIVKSKIDKPLSRFVDFGGDDRDRTDYLLNAIQALSQVSYTPEIEVKGNSEK